MTTLGPPPERQSLYPEPHHAGSWDATAPPRRRRLWILPVVGASIGLMGLVGWLGVELGHAWGSVPVGQPDAPGDYNAIQVAVGTCLSSLPESGTVATVGVTPCQVPHVAEAVADYAFPGEEWPGRDVVVEELLDFCGSTIQPGYSGDSMFASSDWEAGLRWVAWAPTERSWGAGERTGLCVAYRDAGIQGSFLAQTATFVN